MRSLIVRFKDCEGPGILEPILRQKGYRITYHNAYDTRIHLVPEAHLMFDTVLLMGGPQSVVGEENDDFFAPYYQLTENMLETPGRKILGICLGSQIIARVLGARVVRGEKGPEIGFSPVKVEKPNSPLFQGLSSTELVAFHLHEDVFDLPKGSEHLLSSSKYPHQMFSYENKAFAIQAHLELTPEMLEVWKVVHRDFMKQGDKLPLETAGLMESMQASGNILFGNILGQ